MHILVVNVATESPVPDISKVSFAANAFYYKTSISISKSISQQPQCSNVVPFCLHCVTDESNKTSTVNPDGEVSALKHIQHTAKQEMCF